METRYAIHPDHARTLDTKELRREFHASGLFEPGQINLIYSHSDRIIFGGIVPTTSPLALGDEPAPGAEYFLELREAGVINIGGAGSVVVDGEQHPIGPREGIYLGRGTREVTFASDDAQAPARFYLASVPAHKACPTTPVSVDLARRVDLGDPAQSNKRTIFQFVHPDVLDSCQLAMGLTSLEPGNVWNTMPTHTHERRMEVYMYFDLPRDARVFHFMGQPGETRHLVMADGDAAISPPWSIHSGVGTSSYSFIWAMCGENKTFTDMDHVAMEDLK